MLADDALVVLDDDKARVLVDRAPKTALVVEAVDDDDNDDDDVDDLDSIVVDSMFPLLASARCRARPRPGRGRRGSEDADAVTIASIAEREGRTSVVCIPRGGFTRG